MIKKTLIWKKFINIKIYNLYVVRVRCKEYKNSLCRIEKYTCIRKKYIET